MKEKKASEVQKKKKKKAELENLKKQSGEAALAEQMVSALLPEALSTH